MINQVCERSLIIGYAQGADRIEECHVRDAARELDEGYVGMTAPTYHGDSI
jgi:hypothetical protein